MTERSRFWDGSVTGDAVSIGNSELCDRVFRALWNGTGNLGVLAGWLNELEVTDGGANTATVDTGGGIVYGLWYENDAPLNVNVPNGPRTDLIVVRRSWAAQTARITRIAGPGAALTQVAGVTWDIPLAQVVVDGVGALTITDQREFCEFSTALKDAAVTTDALATDGVTTSELENQTRWLTRGAGTLEPDATNPASWVIQTALVPHADVWEFRDAQTDTVWATFRVPADFTGANITLYLHTKSSGTTPGDVRWAFSSWDAQASAVLVNNTGSALVSYPPTAQGPYSEWYFNEIASLGTIAVTAGDIVHLELYRDGTHVNDTYGYSVYLLALEVRFTADD